MNAIKNYLDLFSGIGGFRLGLEQAGFKFEWEGHSEIDKYAKQIYKKHFQKSEDLGDVRTIYKGRLPRIDLITFGFPCQDLSIAGKRRGLDGERSGLFYEAMRIVSECEPDWFIFENVKGLFSSSEGRDFEIVLRTIAELGVYELQWQLLNTKWFLPQNRERIYGVGRHIRNRSGFKVFPIGESNSRSVEPQTGSGGEVERIRKNYSSALSTRDYKDGGDLIAFGKTGSNSQGQRVYSPEGISAQLTAQGGGQGAKTGLYMIQKSDQRLTGKMDLKELCPTLKSETKKGDTEPLVVRPILTPDRIIKRQNGRRMKKAGEDSFTVTSQDRHGVMIAPCLNPNDLRKGYSGQNKQFLNSTGLIRRLTPIECERLQGFPDGWTEGISDSQRYKCLGNAVSVPVVKCVCEKLNRQTADNPS